jgi:alkylation response protein AidB-like acyl-CoA dehydrogenase
MNHERLAVDASRSGLNDTAAALFAHGTEAQKRRFLGPIVRNEEKWCQLISEPGAGSDEWIVNGQKVWKARVPEFQRLSEVNDGWRVANATVSSERQMVASAPPATAQPGSATP